MPPLRPRIWIRKYGSWGVLMAAVYLGLRSLWTERRRVLPAGLLLIVASALLMRPHEKRHSIPAPLPPPTLSPAPPNAEADYTKDQLEHTLQVHEGQYLWRLEIWWPHQGLEVGEYAVYRMRLQRG